DPAKLRLGKEKNIVLVCRSGRRSDRVAQALQQAGFNHVRTLTGGMVAWESSGLLEAIDPIVQAKS
ncbi:MAG: rhodanese-like domain-containing protein, partial [Caldilineaceae bacterium]|nr:rhodanese-like domain-containing protein [Caldilineaceae bacterium]